MSDTKITTLVRVVEDEKTQQSAKADKRKKKTDAEVSAVLKAAFEPKSDKGGVA